MPSSAARAAQLAMTGETFGARQALEWGMLNEVTAGGGHLERAREYAAKLAAVSPTAMRALKRLLRLSERNTFTAQLEAEAVAQSANGSSPEFRAALAAFAAKR